MDTIAPVEICISKSDDDVMIRFRDQGGGIKMEDQPRVWEYSFTTVQKQEEDFLASATQMQQSTGGPIAGVFLIHDSLGSDDPCPECTPNILVDL